MSKFWFAVPNKDGPPTPEEWSSASIVEFLKGNPDMFFKRCVMAPDQSGGWSYPARYGFTQLSESDLHQMEHGFQRAIAELREKDTKDILWEIFKKGAHWCEGWLGESWKNSGI